MQENEQRSGGGKHYTIDCRSITSYQDFIELFNTVLIRPAGGEWGGNLDAFNDYLSWPENVPYRLTILGTDRCKAILNYKAHTRHKEKLWSILIQILSDDNNKEWVEHVEWA